MKVKVFFVLLVFLTLSSVEAMEHNNLPKRLALVIGNGNYPLFPLKNPENDATDLVQSLENLGFTVIFRKNVSNNSFRNALRTFGEQLKEYDVGLFFYAGHGIQVNGINYLLPVDAEIKYEDEIQSQAIPADLVLKKMESAKIDVNILILDACRNNPFTRGFRGITPGLAVMNAPKGTLVAYSTAPGNTAEDGRGRNSPYAKQLIKNLVIPGITIEKLFKHVRVGLSLATKGRQISWESSSLMGDFYFISPDYFDVKKQKFMFGSVEINVELFKEPSVSIDGKSTGSCIDKTCYKSLLVGSHKVQIKSDGKVMERNFIIYPGQKHLINISSLDEVKKNNNADTRRRP